MNELCMKVNVIISSLLLLPIIAKVRESERIKNNNRQRERESEGKTFSCLGVATC
jgi:hypothetical protein